MLSELRNKTAKRRKEADESASDDWRKAIVLTETQEDNPSARQCPYCSLWVQARTQPSPLLQQHQTTHPSEILAGQLYLGDERVSKSFSDLKKCGISAVLNTAIQCDNPFEKELEYLKFFYHDDERQKMDWDKGVDFITKCVQNNNAVYVHCIQGISRSASFVIAYLMKTNQLTLKQALNEVRAKRSIINPNRGFLFQLLEYEALLFPGQEASLKLVPWWSSEEQGPLLVEHVENAQIHTFHPISEKVV
eukprot:Lithocolla_globosa_v1_NODE_1383_length_2618_cov_3.822083.p2 type:complete len:249 gc:universal NODE_1383_length_2618_cov_3.822083:1651-2397(+)